MFYVGLRKSNHVPCHLKNYFVTLSNIKITKMTVLVPVSFAHFILENLGSGAIFPVKGLD